MYQLKKYKFLLLCFIVLLVVFMLFAVHFYPLLLVKQFNNQYIYEYIRNGETKISDSYIIDFSRKIEIKGLYEEDSEKLSYFNCDFIYNITPSDINSFYCTGIIGTADNDEIEKIYIFEIQNGNITDCMEINFLPQQLIMFNEKLCALTKVGDSYSVFLLNFNNKQISELANGINFAEDTANMLFIYKSCLLYPKMENEQTVWYSFDGEGTQIFDTTPLNEHFVAFFENGNLLKFNSSDNTFYDIDGQKLWQISKNGEYKAEYMCQVDNNHILLKITKFKKDLPVSFYVLSLNNGNATNVTEVFSNIVYGDKPERITVM